jgi:CRP/FNR family cyclic AMP-dependent transcriptional regulator
VVNGGGAEREVAVRRAGEPIGELALLGEDRRMATLAARGAVRTLRLDRGRFERILRERPEVALAVIRVLGDRLRESARGPG